MNFFCLLVIVATVQSIPSQGILLHVNPSQEQPTSCDDGVVMGCDGICGSGKVIGGCDSTCGSMKRLGCDGVCGSGKVVGRCDGMCGSTVKPGCDGKCGSGRVIGGCDRRCGSTRTNCINQQRRAFGPQKIWSRPT
mmetsp:Transcript_30961/g.64939  ORF Transcript_30961/g.64939 Transcript_30961/m.64939 type:complete len:136 (-) Transcript_30961:150-557(-)